jgi:2'-5' RNA ligase
MEEKTYSLWLTPSGGIYKRLVNLISDLSEKYSAPNFKPHISLLGPLVGTEKELIAKASQLAAAVKPYEIKFTKLDYLDEYFRCLFVRAEETEAVMSANTKAREIFSGNITNINLGVRYMPHLSLLYGNFFSQIKQNIIEEIGKEFNASFKVESICLFLTDLNEINNWHKVAEFPLNRF